MISAVDTNVLLDVLIPGAAQGDESERALTEAARAGDLIVSPPVYAELAVRFPDKPALDGFIAATGLQLQPPMTEALYRAGKAWQAYLQRRPRRLQCPACGTEQEIECSRCGRSLQPRQHVVSDFLIGAHALVLADRLLTRDRGYYSTYFPELRLG